MADVLMKEIIPEDLQDRPYLKDWLDKPQSKELMADVFKKLDGAEKLVGKKAGVPADDAKPEEWDQFFTKLRPAKADEYEVPVKDPTKDPEFVSTLKEAFHAGNLSKAQAAKLQAKLLPAFEARQAKAIEAQKKMDADFETLSQATFAADNVKVLDRVKTTINELTPANLKPFISKLDNPSLVILAGVINAVLGKYVPEDKLKGGNGGGGGDQTNLREEARKLMASEAYSKWSHPDHAKTVAKVNEMYAQLGAAAKGT